jgi:hypothetical protein
MTFPDTTFTSGTTITSNWLNAVNDKCLETVSLEDFGASATSTPTENAAAFVAAIQAGGRISTPQQAYTFQFDGTPITYTGTTLDIDLGPFKHTFLNFGGIVANDTRALRYNGRFTADDGYCKGLGRFRNLQVVNIETIEITDVFCDTPTTDQQFFGLEYSSNNYDDNQLVINVGNAVFKNIITKTPDFPNATPMTGFGNFGSSSSQVQRHLFNIDNLHVEEFYTVSPSDGTTVIGGDSDFFRLFTNPTNLTINNCYIENVGKRFIKTQEQTYVTVNNLTAILDSRFKVGNYNGTFEGQASSNTIPSRFVIQAAKIDYPSTDTPVFFNANGLPHEMYISNTEFNNFNGLMQSVAGVFYMTNCSGDGFNGNYPLSTQCFLENCVITNFSALNATPVVVTNCSLTLSNSVVSSGYPLGEAAQLENVKLLNWDTNVRVCLFTHLKNVYLDNTRGSAMRRPFRPADGQVCTFEDVQIIQTGGVSTLAAAIESPGVGTSGEVICRDYRSTMTLGFVSSGSWAFVLDNCDDDTVTGAGVTSVVRATYV